MTLDETTRYLHEHIPITAEIGAAVAAYDGSTVRLVAPLAPNLNHRSTAFGGSLSALAILAGWTLLHLNLRERGFDVRLVIQLSQVDFDAPVEGDFAATCALPEPADWARFVATLRRRRMARVRLRGDIEAGGATRGRYEGVYVAVRLDGSGAAAG